MRLALARPRGRPRAGPRGRPRDSSERRSTAGEGSRLGRRAELHAIHRGGEPAVAARVGLGVHVSAGQRRPGGGDSVDTRTPSFVCFWAAFGGLLDSKAEPGSGWLGARARPRQERRPIGNPTPCVPRAPHDTDHRISAKHWHHRLGGREGGKGGTPPPNPVVCARRVRAMAGSRPSPVSECIGLARRQRRAASP